MSGGYSGGSAVGGSGSGDGQTTVVGATEGLSPNDKKVLCDALCKCSAIGVATRGGGRILRQACVAQRLDVANETSRMMSGNPTEYLPEVSYDMRQEPPAPIMSDDDPLQPHGSLLDWIRDKWPGRIGGYRRDKAAGGPGVRRPDVVIVNDPSQPPVQSNIKKVVEMKFDDGFGKGQRDSYVRIAGSRSKYAPLSRANCGCSDKQSEAQSARSTQSHSATDDVFGNDAGSHSSMGPSGLPLPPQTPGVSVFP
ncbi:VRR-NUC domain-containing protein [Burkholderia thailandensis]|uniref:VRR-NUC domain-containing protein n=1 Tax=Burkholderia thailandensis TaxID=57975 RepID=UPI00217E5FBF|nr:VRR-NUC domain-containing protein [Burkholderia thailandensis]MCS6480194.1 VRR-NUC domain-containing protein [Burkholderia thailandensis]